jgi:phosphomannomutase
MGFGLVYKVEMVVHPGKSLKMLLQDFFARVGELHSFQEDVHLTRVQQNCLQAALATPPSTIAGIQVERVSAIDGLKLYLYGGSWVFIRVSGAEPVVRLYAESGREELSRVLLTEAQCVLLI